MATTPSQKLDWMGAGGTDGFRLRHLLSFRWAAVAVIIVGWFVYYPIVDNFIVSTTDEDIFTGEVTNVGLANYQRLFDDPAPEPVTVPTGCSVFPKEVPRISRRWAAKRFTDIRFWSEPTQGGHFAAFEQPDLFVNDVREFFRLVR